MVSVDRSVIALVLQVLIVFCCTDAVVGASDNSSNGVELSVDSLGNVNPDQANLEKVLMEYENYVKKTVSDWRIPGMAIGIVRNGTLIYAKGFGTTEVNGTTPITPDTVFQVGSTTKAFTAALVAIKVDAGNLRWDDRVIDHLEGFRMHDPWVTRQFTVADLLAQHSGLHENAGNFLVTLGCNRSELVRALRLYEPEFDFRSDYGYQNIPFIAASDLVSGITGKDWETNVMEMLFVPLSMKNSSAGLRGFEAAKNAAVGHRMNRYGDIVPFKDDWKYKDWVYIIGPAGGINSNVVDMSLWLKLQIGNGTFDGRRIISEESLRYMHSPLTRMDQRDYYCMGWILEDRDPYPVVWHNGASFGMRSMVAFVPKADVGIVILSNAFTAGPPEFLAFRFFDAYFGRPMVDYSSLALDVAANSTSANDWLAAARPKSPYQELPLNCYVGNYTNEIYGTISITNSSGKLVGRQGPRGVEIAFEHWDRDVYLMSIPEFLDGEGFARFQIGLDGVAESVTMDLFSEGGSAVYRRIGEQD
jgi:CubicO group peptidase (beta-lactamase class C family)